MTKLLSLWSLWFKILLSSFFFLCVSVPLWLTLCASLDARKAARHPARMMGRLVFLFTLLALPALAADVEPGKVFKDCADCPELVMIPAGNYDMGALVVGKNTFLNRSLPVHHVTIPKPFAFGRYETTFDDWELCHKAGACEKDPDDHTWGKGKRPVINVSVPEVEQYLAWLSKKTGHKYRLPTEAEWEYAARAGTKTKFSWGDEAGKTNANCRTCAPEISKETYPVGGYKPNPWGLYDIHGNVWEWTQDCWNENYNGAPTDGSAWRTGDCNFRVQRGGSWYYVDVNAQSDFRSKYSALDNGFSYGIGFRMVRELP
jgi:formylglycine-generating enzyme required for sulfatase activity